MGKLAISPRMNEAELAGGNAAETPGKPVAAMRQGQVTTLGRKARSGTVLGTVPIPPAMPELTGGDPRNAGEKWGACSASGYQRSVK